MRNAMMHEHAATYDWADVLGRAGLAAIFIWSGVDKVIHHAGNLAYMGMYHIPMAGALIWVAAAFEIVAGAMLLLGWQARTVAFLLAGYTLITALIFHNFWAVPADQAQNQTIHFMKNIAMAGGLLHVVALGTGAFAAGARAHQ